MGDVARATQLIGLGATVGGAVFQSRALEEGFRAQEEAAKFNASLVRQRGEERVRALRVRNRRAKARTFVKFAKAGVRTDVGTPLSTMAFNAEELEREALNARFEAENEARLFETRARTARSSRKASAGASLLTGAARTSLAASRIFGAG